MMDDEVSLREAGYLLDVTRQAVSLAIKKGRIAARRLADGSLRISIKELDRYIATRYKRRFTTKFNGEYAFSENTLTAMEASELMGVSAQRVYYLIRIGILIPEVKGGALVLNKEEVLTIKQLEIDEEELEKKESVSF